MAIQSAYENIDPVTGLPYASSGKLPTSTATRAGTTNPAKGPGVAPTYRTPETALSFDPYQTGTLNAYNQNQNNWYVATGAAKIKKPDGTEVPNPFDLTPEEVYLALSGNPEAITRLKASLAARGKDDMFHNIVNYYEAGGGGFNGGGYTAEDAARASMNYNKSNSKLDDPYYLPGGAGYGSKEAIALGYGGGSSGAPVTGGGGLGQGNLSGGTSSGGGVPNPNSGAGAPGSTTGVPPGGSTNLGNSGDSGDFPMASAAQASAYTAAPRPTSTTDPFDFMNDEGYKFMLEEGTKGIQNSAAARGNLQSGNTLKDLAKYQTGLASQEYGNAFNRYDTSRKFAEGQYTGDRAFDFGAQTDARNYNNSNRMWDTSFNNNNRIDARNFDYAAATGDRAFNWAKDVDNRNFGYQAATGDRAYNTTTLQNLANMGLNASGNSGSLAATLAAILGQNTMTGAGAGANATVGTGNNTNAFISNLLNMLYGNSVVNSVNGGG